MKQGNFPCFIGGYHNKWKFRPSIGDDMAERCPLIALLNLYQNLFQVKRYTEWTVFDENDNIKCCVLLCILSFFLPTR